MKHRKLSAALLAGLLLIASLGGCGPKPVTPPAYSAESGTDAALRDSDTLPPAETIPQTEPDTEAAPSEATYRLQALTYPPETLQALADDERAAFVARATGDASYEGNRHRTGTNLTLSPYYTATAHDVALPVYATPVMTASGGARGVWHSFASIDVDFGQNASLTIRLEADAAVPANTAQVFSAYEATVTLAEHTVTLEVSRHGVYTVLLDDSQDTAVTVFVRPYIDEEAEIAAYRETFGADRVTVLEPGLHTIDHLSITASDSVLYLRAGAVLLPRHTMDIGSDEQNASAAEEGASADNELGLNRYPTINAHRVENIRIVGRGTVDMTEMDWHERRGVVFSLCDRVTVEGLLLINPAEWALITYRCTDVTIRSCGVLGYRTNSDAFAICNSREVVVEDCFARTGDDMFEVKCLGGPAEAVSESIRFSRCQAWGSKARCFGIIGEMERDISNVLFEDGIVIWRDATWDNDRIGSLVVIRESGTGTVRSITFRRMLVHRDEGRAINCVVYNPALTDTRMESIRFEDVTYNADLPSQCKAGTDTNHMAVTLCRVTCDDRTVTKRNLSHYFLRDRGELVSVEE